MPVATLKLLTTRGNPAYLAAYLPNLAGRSVVVAIRFQQSLNHMIPGCDKLIRAPK